MTCVCVYIILLLLLLIIILFLLIIITILLFNNTRAVTAVHIPWLPTLATLLRTNTPPTTLPPLPPPMVNELLTVQPPAGPLQGVVVVGTAITGTAVVGVTRGGGDGGSCVPVVVWPSFGGCGGGVGGGFLAATPVQSIEQGDSEEAIDTMVCVRLCL